MTEFMTRWDNHEDNEIHSELEILTSLQLRIRKTVSSQKEICLIKNFIAWIPKKGSMTWLRTCQNNGGIVGVIR